ncbi:MAG TPA: response regulator [Opitutaceae bacterium]|nr:response regulator [Opitutaceae bacterium]
MKILHLEDNVTDAELAQSLFADEWPDCEIKVVDNRPDFLANLHEGYDLILSDFSLVNFNGLEALTVAHEKFPDIPFIFFSGTIGEERALAALRAGARDYVIKDRPRRLITAIERAMKDARLERERKATEAQMLRVQRLENIGMLAAGMAHDFNNVLAPVLMGVPLLRSRLEGEGNQRILNSIESSAARGAGLVRQILGFAHGATGAPQLIQPKHLIKELVGVMQQTFPKNIKIVDETEGGLWPLTTNPTHFHQILLNLCVNARDAMPDGGTLTLRARNRQLDDLSAAAIPGLSPGPFLAFEVADTGTGIPPAVLTRIWDPFFTTKEAGRGTGLGLATVRGIVENHKGSITVQTQAGHGTSFQILLPAMPGTECATGPAGTSAIPRGQGELILVADDDANVRDVTSATLTDHGYRVLAAADGTEAVALFAPRSLDVKVLITDLDMPNLDGAALTRIVRTMNPTIQVVTVSGSAEANDPRRHSPLAGTFLAKPFTSELLLTTIHELLSRKSLAAHHVDTAPAMPAAVR